MLRKIMPEECYPVTNLSMMDVIEAKKKHLTIQGKVESIDNASKMIYVKLGFNLMAMLPFNEATIYPFTYSKNPEFVLPFQLYCLRDKQISVKVTKIKSDKILLSRKKNMEESFKYLKNASFLDFYITAVNTTEVFGDIGDGLVARLPMCKLCQTRIRSASEIVRKNELIEVKVILCDEKLKRFNVSYKDVFEKYRPQNFRSGEHIVCTVNEAIDSSMSGFYASATPQVVGIVDNDKWVPRLRYGDKIECIITRATKKGLHLKFYDFIKEA